MQQRRSERHAHRARSKSDESGQAVPENHPCRSALCGGKVLSFSFPFQSNSNWWFCQEDHAFRRPICVFSRSWSNPGVLDISRIIWHVAFMFVDLAYYLWCRIWLFTELKFRTLTTKLVSSWSIGSTRISCMMSSISRGRRRVTSSKRRPRYDLILSFLLQRSANYLYFFSDVWGGEFHITGYVSRSILLTLNWGYGSTTVFYSTY